MKTFLNATRLAANEHTMAGRSRWWHKLNAVLPHEWVFGTFLWMTGLWLFMSGGAAREWSLVFWGCWLTGIGIFCWAERNLTSWRWRVRLLFYPAAMGLSFFALGIAVPLVGNPRMDWLLVTWDRMLIGHTPSMILEPWLYPWLEDLAMAAYLFFFFYLITGPGHYCVQNLRLFRKCIVGLFTLYGLAFIGYTILPAGGPHIYLNFKTPLQGPYVVNWALGWINGASNGLDVFPSVHVAGSLYLLLFDWKHWRTRFWWVLLPCIMIWFSTLYLRFHYFVDVMAAVVVALISWWVAEKYESSTAHLPMLATERAASEPVVAKSKKKVKVRVPSPLLSHPNTNGV